MGPGVTFKTNAESAYRYDYVAVSRHLFASVSSSSVDSTLDLATEAFQEKEVDHIAATVTLTIIPASLPPAQNLAFSRAPAINKHDLRNPEKVNAFLEDIMTDSSLWQIDWQTDVHRHAIMLQTRIRDLAKQHFPIQRVSRPEFISDASWRLVDSQNACKRRMRVIRRPRACRILCTTPYPSGYPPKTSCFWGGGSQIFRSIFTLLFWSHFSPFFRLIFGAIFGFKMNPKIGPKLVQKVVIVWSLFWTSF